METRSVYRQVEETALLGLFERGDYYHSRLSELLRYKYREYKDFRDHDLAQLLAVSSLYGNSTTDIDAGNKFVKDRFRSFVGRIPYLRSKERPEGAARDDAVSHYIRVMKEYDRIVDSIYKKEENISQSNTDSGR